MNNTEHAVSPHPLIDLIETVSLPRKDELLIFHLKTVITAEQMQEVAQVVRNFIGRSKLEGEFILVRGEADIQTLSEDEMNKLGWYRKQEND